MPLGHERSFQRSVLASAVSHRRMAMQADHNHVAYVTMLSSALPITGDNSLPKFRADEATRHLLRKAERAFPECDIFIYGGEEVAVHSDCFEEIDQKEQFILDQLVSSIDDLAPCPAHGEKSKHQWLRKARGELRKHLRKAHGVSSQDRITSFAITHTHAVLIVVGPDGNLLRVDEIRKALHAQCRMRHEVQVKAVGYKEFDDDPPTSDEVGRHSETTTRYLIKNDTELSDPQVRLSHIYRGMCANGGLFSFVMTTRTTPPSFIGETTKKLCDIRRQDMMGTGFPAICNEPMTRREIEDRIMKMPRPISQIRFDQARHALVSKRVKGYPDEGHQTEQRDKRNAIGTLFYSSRQLLRSILDRLVPT